jgi:hypothetical protein
MRSPDKSVGIFVTQRSEGCRGVYSFCLGH